MFIKNFIAILIKLDIIKKHALILNELRIKIFYLNIVLS